VWQYGYGKVGSSGWEEVGEMKKYIKFVLIV